LNVTEEGYWRSVDMHAYTKLTVLRQSLMLMGLFRRKKCEDAFEERRGLYFLLDLEWLDFQRRFEGNDIELGCKSGRGKGREKKGEMYRIHKIDWPVFEGVIHLTLQWKRSELSVGTAASSVVPGDLLGSAPSGSR
jgi:hypothetical protein